MNKETLHIVDRFSGQRKRIIFLMTNDSEFYSLCQDYEDCVNALSYWSTSECPEAKSRVDEYSELIKELEYEVDEKLQLSDP